MVFEGAENISVSGRKPEIFSLWTSGNTQDTKHLLCTNFLWNTKNRCFNLFLVLIIAKRNKIDNAAFSSTVADYDCRVPINFWGGICMWIHNRVDWHTHNASETHDAPYCTILLLISENVSLFYFPTYVGVENFPLVNLMILIKVTNSLISQFPFIFFIKIHHISTSLSHSYTYRYYKADARKNRKKNWS